MLKSTLTGIKSTCWSIWCESTFFWSALKELNISHKKTLKYHRTTDQPEALFQEKITAWQ